MENRIEPKQGLTIKNKLTIFINLNKNVYLKSIDKFVKFFKSLKVISNPARYWSEILVLLNRNKCYWTRIQVKFVNKALFVATR